MSIYEKLLNIQNDLTCNKGQYNDFGKYSYRSCEDILESVKPLLKANKCLLFLSDELVNIGERYYIKAQAKLVDAEEGQEIVVDAFAREEESKKGMDGSQVTGASSSYARKYALNGLFCIDDQKDSDATNKHGKDAPAPEKKIYATPKQLEIIKGYKEETQTGILKSYNITVLEELKLQDATDIIKRKNDADKKRKGTA